MKISLNKSSGNTETPFPKLMQSLSSHAIVFFWESGKGTVLSSIYHKYLIGNYNEAWQMEHFVDFKGSITLENDPCK